jgi:hypothetical protein
MFEGARPCGARVVRIGQTKKSRLYAGFFSVPKDELLLHFFSSSLGSIGSSIDGVAGSLGSFASGVACNSGCVSRGLGGIRGGFSSCVSGSSIGRGGIGRSGCCVSRDSDRSGFGNRSRRFFGLRAGGEGEGEQGGGEEGLFHF